MGTTTRVIAARPCAKCPFLAKYRGELDYLHPARRPEIMRSVHGGSTFACHETTTYDEETEEMIQTSESLPCAGLALVVLRAGFEPPGSLKFAERLGMFDAQAFLDSNANVETWTHEQATGLDTDEEIETCNTVGPYCLAPAGYMEGGAVIRGMDAADGECPACGEAVCSECADEEGLCGTCTETEEDDE
jgi:hypothetical protein